MQIRQPRENADRPVRVGRVRVGGNQMGEEGEDRDERVEGTEGQLVCANNYRDRRMKNSVQKTRAEGFWEAHRKYLDVQYVAAGFEHMGYAAAATLQAGRYEEDKDFIKLEGDGEFFLLSKGYFCILAPQDAHMPGMALGPSAPVLALIPLRRRRRRGDG